MKDTTRENNSAMTTYLGKASGTTEGSTDKKHHGGKFLPIKPCFKNAQIPNVIISKVNTDKLSLKVSRYSKNSQCLLLKLGEKCSEYELQWQCYLMSEQQKQEINYANDSREIIKIK